MSDNNKDKEQRRIPCCSCGLVFWIPEETADAWQKNGHSFVCPNGHSLSWKTTPLEQEARSLRANVASLETDLATARKELADVKRELDLWKPRGA